MLNLVYYIFPGWYDIEWNFGNNLNQYVAEHPVTMVCYIYSIEILGPFHQHANDGQQAKENENHYFICE